MFSQPLSHLIQRIRSATEELCREHAKTDEVLRGVFLFTANGLQLATEIARCSANRTASWLLARTLRYNAGSLALFLLDPRGPTAIALLLDSDNDVRAKDILINETSLILGQAHANDLLKDSGFDMDAFLKRIQKNAADSVAWRKIKVKDLEFALGRVCSEYAKRSAGIGKELATFVVHSRLAISRGDNFAHPNLFGIQTLSQVVDLDRAMICLDPPGHLSDHRLAQVAAIQLLFLHIAAIQIRFPKFVDLAEVLADVQALVPDEDAAQ